MVTLGVIADTHVPDKSPRLHPRILEIFRAAGVQAILHAGDISTPGVLAQLEQLAPVYAVKGNRDWVYLNHLPLQRTLTFAGVKVGLAHGHGGFWRYFQGKVQYLRQGYQIENFVRPLMADFLEVQVVVFGHTHRAVNLQKWSPLDGVLVFNPGAACCADQKENIEPSVGLLRIEDGGRLAGEVIPF